MATRNALKALGFFAPLLFATQALAALALDGSVGQGQGNGATSAPVTQGAVALTNDIVIVDVTLTRTNAQGSATTVSTVTDTLGLTWNKRSGVSFHSGATGTDWITIERWWALRAAASNTTITVTAAATFDNITLEAYAINGAKTATPFDTNVSLPATGNSSANTASAPTVTGVSTNCDKTMVLLFSGASRSAGSYAAQTAGTGYTLIDSQSFAGGTDFMGDAVQRQTFAATQSGIAPIFAVTSWTGWVAVADAVQDATATCASGATGAPNRLLLGVGQ